MSQQLILPSLEALKEQAKRLRSSLAAAGNDITHSKSLELIAAQHGFRDWNTLFARIGNQPDEFRLVPGDHVRGRYLGQAFSGRVIGIETLTHADGLRKVTLDFDEAVDVVEFESFSAFRKRVTCTIDDNGCSPARTSNGRPHMVLDGKARSGL